MRDRPRDDRAQLHLISVIVIITLFMIPAVTFVTSLQRPTQSSVHHMIEESHTHQARWFLNMMADFPLFADSCAGKTMLDQIIVESVTGDSTEWNHRTKKYFAPGSQVALLLDNGIGILPLQESSPFFGTTQDIPFSPDWDWARPIQALSPLNGQSRSIVDVPGFRAGSIVAANGESIRVRVTSLNPTGIHLLDSWMLVSVPSPGHAESGTPVLSWVDDRSRTLALVTRLPLESISTREVLLHLWISGGEDRGIEAQRRIVINIPAGWEFLGSDNAGGWIEVNKSTNVIEFRQSQSIEAILGLRLRPPSLPLHPVDLFQAYDATGLASSTLAVTYGTSLERGMTRSVHLTHPYVVELGGRAELGAVFVNGGPRTTVTRIDVEIPGGYDLRRHGGRGAALFAGPEPPEVVGASDASGTWSWVDARHLRWEGRVTVEAGGAAFWAVAVNVTDDASQATAVEPPGSPGPVGRLAFANGHVATSSAWGEVPGVIRHRVPPDDPATPEGEGYAWGDADTGRLFEAPLAVEVASPGATLRAEASYRVGPQGGDLVSLEGAAGNASFRIEGNRLVPVGGVVRVAADFESLAHELARLGATDLNVSVEMYAPPSMGCKPTATWWRDAGSMPLAPLRDVEVWAPEGVPAVFAVAEDGHAYRLDAHGVPQWSHRLGAPGTRVAPAAFGPHEAALFVGARDGTLLRLDPLLGSRAWAAVAGAREELDEGAPVAAIAVEASRARVAVAAGNVLEVRHAADGARLARAEAGVADGAFRDVAWASDGGLVALHDRGVTRFDAMLRASAWRNATALAVAATPDGVLVAEPDAVRLLDAGSLAVLVERPLPAAAVLAAAGDATGDGVADLALVVDRLDLVLIDGSDLREAYRKPFDVPASSGVRLELSPFDPRLDDQGPQGGEPRVENCRATWPTYQSSSMCLAPRAGAHAAAEPARLDVAPGRLLFAYRFGGIPYAQHAALSGIGDWTMRSPGTAPATALAAGGWTTPGSIRVLVAEADGVLVARDGETGASEWSAAPTEFVGRFTFQTRIPEGGFFGPHLLVAKLAWTSEDGTEHAARRFDWLVVTDADGRPVTRPAYRVVLNVRDPTLG